MKNIMRLTFWTVGLSLFVIIGAGHGIACMGLLEIVGLLQGFNFGSEDFSLSLSASYDTSLSAAAVFTLIGQLLLLVSLLIKPFKTQFWTKVVGLLILWLGFYYLTHNLAVDSLAQVGFISGLPFLVVSFILAFNIIGQKPHLLYD